MSLYLILKLNEYVPTFEFPHIIQILGLLQTHSTITNYSIYVLRCKKSCKWQLHQLKLHQQGNPFDTTIDTKPHHMLASKFKPIDFLLKYRLQLLEPIDHIVRNFSSHVFNVWQPIDVVLANHSPCWNPPLTQYCVASVKNKMQFQQHPLLTQALFCLPCGPCLYQPAANCGCPYHLHNLKNGNRDVNSWTR